VTGHLIFCTTCQRAIEGVLLAPTVEAYRATAEFADDHEDRHGHWPTRVHIHEASTRALRLIGARR
jgi:hypothetical protein